MSRLGLLGILALLPAVALAAPRGAGIALTVTGAAAAGISAYLFHLDHRRSHPVARVPTGKPGLAALWRFWWFVARLRALT